MEAHDMNKYLQALRDQRSHQAELLRQLQAGEFGAFERAVDSMRALKNEQVTRLQGIVAELDNAILQVEQVVAKMTNSGQL
jgi:hypothetical protein